MDLLRNMLANREQKGLNLVKPAEPNGKSKKTGKNVEGDELVPGTKQKRAEIIEKKPAKKQVIKHLQALIDKECESSSDEE